MHLPMLARVEVQVLVLVRRVETAEGVVHTECGARKALSTSGSESNVPCIAMEPLSLRLRVG